MLQTMRELTGLGVVIRLEQVTLVPVELDQENVVEIAMENRLDLMNRRGIVTDVRRRLEVAAEQLLSDVNLVAEGEISTQDPSINSNPLDLRRSESSFRAGVSIVTPLDRVRQRNNYRAAQVGFQRARRNFMAAEDQVKLDVRRYLRHLEIERRLFEVNRRALRVAARELDQAIEFGDRPDADSRPGGRGVNISRALDNIVYTQNELIESWVDYETARMALYRDMGLMEIDENGNWR
jgi:outer membrane protein TolC